MQHAQVLHDVNRTVAALSQRMCRKYALPLTGTDVSKLPADRLMGPLPALSTAVLLFQKGHASIAHASYDTVLGHYYTAITSHPPMIRLAFRDGVAHVEVDRDAHKAWKRRFNARLNAGGDNGDAAICATPPPLQLTSQLGKVDKSPDGEQECSPQALQRTSCSPNPKVSA